MENCKDIVDMVMSKHVSKAGRMDSGLDEAMLRDDKAADVLRRSRGMLEMVTQDLGCVFLGYPTALMMTALRCMHALLGCFSDIPPLCRRANAGHAGVRALHCLWQGL